MDLSIRAASVLWSPPAEYPPVFTEGKQVFPLRLQAGVQQSRAGRDVDTGIVW